MFFLPTVTTCTQALSVIVGSLFSTWIYKKHTASDILHDICKTRNSSKARKKTTNGNASLVFGGLRTDVTKSFRFHSAFTETVRRDYMNSRTFQKLKVASVYIPCFHLASRRCLGCFGIVVTVKVIAEYRLQKFKSSSSFSGNSFSE